MTKQEFLDACKSARVVKTHTELAILIGDEVFEIRSGMFDRVQLLGMALRGETLAPSEYRSLTPSKEWVA